MRDDSTKIEPAGPDPLIAVIRRNFAAYAAQYGVEQASDTGPLLREIDRLERLLAESTKIECNCMGKSDEATRIRLLNAHINVLVMLLAEFASAGNPDDPRGMQVRTLLAESLTDPGSRDQFLNRNGIVVDAIDAHWLECPTGNCRHSVFMHDTSSPEPWCRARDCQGEACGPEGSAADPEDEG